MEAYLLDALALFTRWVHLIVGIAWIGASFYFVWLDNHLLSPAEAEAGKRGVGGELWAVHGGGFYHSQKYRVAPPALPSSLHWFYWEAYSTWLSGFLLLCLLYYGHAETYLIDPRVASLSKPAAIAIGLGSLVATWIIYDLLCRSPLGQRTLALGAVLAVVLGVEAYLLCHVFSGRGAFIQFGAALGTIMVANVFFVIIPGQRELVRAKRENREPDPIHGIRGKQRSVHNTYFTLPVLFTMISNHYATAFGAHYNWLVLVAMSLGGALIRAWFVARHKAHERGGRTPPWHAVAGIAILLAVVFALAPSPSGSRPAATQTPAQEFAAVREVIGQRCVPCHAASPTFAGIATAPKGVMLDTPESLLAAVPQLQQQLETHAMPIGNITQMSDEERARVLAWIQHGAPH